ASIGAARNQAEAMGLRNIRFIESDADGYARSLANKSLDAAVSTETFYNVPGYENVLADLYRALRPGGLLAVSFRSQWYDLLKSVKARDFDSAKMVSDARQGCWGGGAVWSSWHTTTDIIAVLGNIGFEPPVLRAL